MIFKGGLIFPILCLFFTIFIFYIAIEKQVFLNFDNAENILFNGVCFIFFFLTLSAFFLFPREVYLDSENIIVKSPLSSVISSKSVKLSTVNAFKIQSLLRVPGYWIRLYINSSVDKKESQIDLSFNIKGSDLDKLVSKLKELKIKQRYI